MGRRGGREGGAGGGHLGALSPVALEVRNVSDKSSMFDGSATRGYELRFLTLHPTPDTLHPASCILHPTPYTQNGACTVGLRMSGREPGSLSRANGA